MPEKISKFIQAASVGATGDSRLKRSEDSSPDETREIRLEDGRGKKSYCHGICEIIRVPEKSCREVLEKRLPKIWYPDTRLKFYLSSKNKLP